MATIEELNRLSPKQILERQKALAAAKTPEMEEADKEETLADKLKMAEAFELSPEEKSTYLEQDKPTNLKDAVAKSESISKETQGIGPFADSNKYAAAIEKPLIDKQKDEVPSPVKTVKNITEKQTDKKTTDDFSTELNSLKDRITQATSTRDEERKRADIGQLAERLGQALAQIGAAQAGMRSGVDLSNITKGLPTIDWDAKRKEMTDDYKTTLAEISDERRTLQQKLERAQDKEQRERFHQDDLKLKKEENAATERYRNQTVGITAMNAQTQREAVQLRGTIAGAKEAAKAEATSGKATASQVAALNELNAALEAGDEKASSAALGKLPIDMQERINQAGGFFGKPKSAQIKEEVGGLSKPAAPSIPSASGGQDPQVAAFAKQYQLDYNKAKGILIKRGYTPKE